MMIIGVGHAFYHSLNLSLDISEAILICICTSFYFTFLHFARSVTSLHKYSLKFFLHKHAFCWPSWSLTMDLFIRCWVSVCRLIQCRISLITFIAEQWRSQVTHILTSLSDALFVTLKCLIYASSYGVAALVCYVYFRNVPLSCFLLSARNQTLPHT